MSKIIQLSQFLGKTLSNTIGNSSKKALLDLAVPLAKDISSKLEIKATASVLDNFERKVNRRGAVRAGKGFTSGNFIHYKVYTLYYA